jgi:hydrogenase/urease accessory protein HupE
MRNLQVGSNFAIFVLFFGLSLLEALRAHSWHMAAIWGLFALLFLVADRREQRAAVRR